MPGRVVGIRVFFALPLEKRLNPVWLAALTTYNGVNGAEPAFRVQGVL
jgi:hypothetical protein